MTDSVPALSITGLVKLFDQKVVVDGIDLEMPTGSFYVLVGPNGAGKTTTLSMATGLMRPDAGGNRIHGVDVWQNLIVAKRLVVDYSAGLRPDARTAAVSAR